MSKAKILLIEDDEMLSTLYAGKFKNEGYEVFTANNGLDGIKLAEIELPTIILLDIIMPKMDGFVALKKLRKNEKTKEIPVMLLTNLGQEEDVKKGKALGATDYFIKANHTPSEIVMKVQELIEKKK